VLRFFLLPHCAAGHAPQPLHVRGEGVQDHVQPHHVSSSTPSLVLFVIVLQFILTPTQSILILIMARPDPSVFVCAYCRCITETQGIGVALLFTGRQARRPSCF
jgi:hypothetical protein